MLHSSFVPSEIIQKFSFRRREAHKNPCRVIIIYCKLGKFIFHEYIPNTYVQHRSLEQNSHVQTYDPSKWKTQDHYAMLNLQDKRHLSTDQEIKTSYRKMILIYHPDKIQDTNTTSGSSIDARFQCIQKAYEILSDPEKRKQYDSIDPCFDESIPSAMTKDQVEKDLDLFFSIYGEAFQRNSRFSVHLPVPSFGNISTPLESVEYFYEFWYNFESRRTFEYLDEEDPAIADNRYDRRAIEKSNKLNRQKKKSQDNARIYKLVDQAKSLDPRISKLEELEKLEREKLKEQRRIAREKDKKMKDEDRTRKLAEFEKLKLSDNSQQYSQYEETITYDNSPWSQDEIQLLLAAVKKIPGGVKNRWHVIRDYITQHSSQHLLRSVESIVCKSKEIQKETNWDQLQSCKKNTDPRIHQTTASINPNPSNNAQLWTPQEQKALEDALKRFPANISNRWDEIASVMEEWKKTKKDCMLRCKELAIMAMKQKKSE